MKKVIVLILLAMLVGCSSKEQKANMKAYVDLDENHNYIEVDYAKIVSKLLDREDGIYLIGYAENDASKDFAFILNEVLSEKGKNAYYIDTRSDKFTPEVQKKYMAFDERLSTNKRSNNQVPYVIVIGHDELNTLPPRINDVDLGSRHLTNVEAELIKEKLYEYIK